MNDYPAMAAHVDQVEPVPRRIRATLAGTTVLDTTAARYVWEWRNYPQFYVPLDDVTPGLLVADGETRSSTRGTAELHSIHVGEVVRPGAAQVLRSSPIDGLDNTVRFDWPALDAWFEEDEQVFVHPRNPYARVDALRSTRTVRIELDGIVLAESSSPVMVFETGLPTRYYLNRTDVDFSNLVATDTTTACPYKGVTSGYWSAHVGDTEYADIAWAYDFPTRELLAVSGLVAFYNERVDVILDGRRLDRPVTTFSRGGAAQAGS